MADAVVSTKQLGRIGGAVVPRLIPITVTPSTTTYANASGGLPIDLAATLVKNAPPGAPHIRPDDVLGVLPIATSTAGYIPLGLTKGTAVYTSGVLTSAPAWIKLVGIGASASQYAAFGPCAEGSNSDPFDVWLVVAPQGPSA